MSEEKPPVAAAPSRGGHLRSGREGSLPPGTGLLGMWIFLAALGVFFAAAIVGYLAVRAGSESWPPPGMPPLPRGMWLATALLLGASYTVETALRRIRAGLPSALKRYLASTLALLLAFLLVQVWNWRVLLASEITARSNLYAFTFFLLTGLHGAHVLGGIAAVAAVTARAWKGRYGSGFHPGVHYSALYVHFLDGVWLVLFVVLQLSR